MTHRPWLRKTQASEILLRWGLQPVPTRSFPTSSTIRLPPSLRSTRHCPCLDHLYAMSLFAHFQSHGLLHKGLKKREYWKKYMTSKPGSLSIIASLPYKYSVGCFRIFVSPTASHSHTATRSRRKVEKARFRPGCCRFQTWSVHYL